MKPFRSSGQSFNEIPLTDPKKSSFDLSYTNKGSGKIGRLIPVSQKECLPGDRISCDVHSLLRFEPLAVPLLSDMNLRHHQYFVPFRQVWSSFESFITGGKDGYSDSHVVPSVNFFKVCNALMMYFVNMILKSGFEPDPDDQSLTTGISAVVSAGVPFDCKIRINVRGTTKADSMSDTTVVDYQDFVYKLNNLQRTILDIFYERRLFTTPGGEILSGRELYYDSYFTSRSYTPYTFDIVRYNLEFVLRKWDQRNVLTVLDPLATNVPMSDVVRYVDEFCQDLYEIIYGPYIGAGSVWDYLGYPVNYIYKNGYNGLYGDNQDDATANALSYPYVRDYNWQLFTGSRSYQVCTRGIYTPSLHIGNDFYTARFFMFPSLDFLDSVTQYSVLPLRAMYRIWYYNYRDQNLEAQALDPDSSAFKADLGINYLMDLLSPRCCAWSKDTFTTATLQAYSTNLVVPIRDETETQLEESTLEIPVVDLPEGTSQNATIKIPTHFVQTDNSPLASISGLTLSNLRKVQALARWLDKNLFVGFQYADQLFSHYNVKYSDARLQIPEYLAGNSEIVRMEVITNNTTIPGAQTAGDQVARAQGLTRSSVDGYFVEEHGLYFAIMSVLPDQSYPFGVDRSLLMTNKFDIAFPEFAQLGSDIVNTGELFATGYKDYKSNEFPFFKAFGYQGRYYHYKYNRNEQHGELNTTRREWTFARFFDRAPVLDADFIHCTPNLQMFVSPYSDQFVYDVLINLRAQRSLPVYDQVL